MRSEGLSAVDFKLGEERVGAGAVEVGVREWAGVFAGMAGMIAGLGVMGWGISRSGTISRDSGGGPSGVMVVAGAGKLGSGNSVGGRAPVVQASRKSTAMRAGMGLICERSFMVRLRPGRF